MTHWKITGIIATIVIILSIPLSIMRTTYFGGLDQRVTAEPDAVFMGSNNCKDCHRQEYDKWKTSHHQMAMAEASEETVLGDFKDTIFECFGVKSRFYRKDGKFYVHTQGPDGRMGDFEITHTFGGYPLQQYLVPFSGGRLQCLPIAWDVQKKQWYHLYPSQSMEPDDWLYWTNAGQNWNGMCAECHSTNLRKNYDFNNDTYQTTWSEISVGCEACHGPASEHVKWAEMPDMGRPQTDNDKLVVKTKGLSSRQQIELCAPCHSRRMSLDDNIHMHSDFLDYGVPQLLNEGYYFSDGQILEEVYVYGSFMQSKMYNRDVRCSDCHDVHSIKPIKQGNDLCLQCHKAAIYNTRNHHFHKTKGEKGEPIKSKSGEVLFRVGSGAECQQCHMPGRYYMGIDYRPDHSFRLPRPDLSLKIGTPNACNRCHFDKNNQWSVDTLMKWYGQRKRPHYGTILNAGRKRQADAVSDLVHLADDRLYPAIVRATALSLLSSYPEQESRQAFQRALIDEEALMRQTAVRYLVDPDPRKRIRIVGPLLYDPVKAVRIEAAQNLNTMPTKELKADLNQKFQLVLDEYRLAMERIADFAAARHNLGNLYAHQGEMDAAAANYRKAIEIDRAFYPAKVNLAMIYNQMKKNDEAERLLREVVTDYPDLYEIKYSLGLLLGEQKKFAEATEYLQAAATGLPQRARIHYNLGLLLQHLKRDAEAESALLRALEIEPGQMDYLYALAEFYLQRGKLLEAKPLAERMIAKHPNRSVGHDLLNFINRRLQIEKR